MRTLRVLAAATRARWGALSRALPALLAAYAWPLDVPPVLTSTFGEFRAHHFHGGIDFSTGRRLGLPVRALADGSVVRVRASGVGYGRAVYLLLDDGRTAVYAHLDNSEVLNEFAAVPSFHFGWILLVALAVYQTSRSTAARILCWSLPIMMLLAIVFTANHYVVDAIIGGAVVLLALGAVRLGEWAFSRQTRERWFELSNRH